MRIGVLGASGQVGAEVTLILASFPGVEVVPIARNASSSAFLRYHGLRCRHGLITSSSEAPRLVGDCEVVVNLALAAGRPREARTHNRLIAENLSRYSPSGAKVIYFSSLVVYGNPYRETNLLRFRSAYAREKLRGEKFTARLAKRDRKQAFILRLGHVCGSMQNITHEIRESLSSGTVYLPFDGAIASNTIYTATIAEAILNIARGQELPGTYDLLSVPQWTWKKVYAHEAELLGIPLVLDACGGKADSTFRQLIGRAVRSLTGAAGWSDFVKQIGLSVLAHAPVRIEQRVHARYLTNRARSEVGAMAVRRRINPALEWVPLGRRFLTSLSDTDVLLRSGVGSLPPPDPRLSFPENMPLATHPSRSTSD